MRDLGEVKKEHTLQKMREEIRDIARIKNSPEGKREQLLKLMEENQRFWSSKVFHHE